MTLELSSFVLVVKAVDRNQPRSMLLCYDSSNPAASNREMLFRRLWTSRLCDLLVKPIGSHFSPLGSSRASLRYGVGTVDWVPLGWIGSSGSGSSKASEEAGNNSSKVFPC